MTAAKIAKLHAKAPAHNVVNVPTVIVYLQRHPGTTGDHRGIGTLDYDVLVAGKVVRQDTTKDDGRALVPVPPGTVAILRILGTDYEIHRLLNVAPPETMRGIQQRLAMLGYHYGPLVPGENIIANKIDFYDNPDWHTEQAMLDFQADSGLFPDALFGPKSRKTLDDSLQSASVVHAGPSDYETRKAAIGAHARLKKTVHKWIRIVPVRFARAPIDNDPTKDSGPPDGNAPDPDDRGYVGCIKTAHRAAVLPVGFDPRLPQQAETRVRLLRVNIADVAALYVTSSDPAVLQITSPLQNVAKGAAKVQENRLPDQEQVMIKFRALKTGNCFLEVRFNAQDGPTLHRIQVTVNELRLLQVKAHAPVIQGIAYNDSGGNAVPAQSAFNTLAAITNRFSEVNKIYFPYGIAFEVMNNVDTSALNHHLRGSVDLTDRWNAAAGAWESEYTSALQNQREEHGAINVVFVPQIVELDAARATLTTGPDIVGGVASSATANPTTYGLFLADWAQEPQTVAHEIGHILNLVNDPAGSGASATLEFVHVNARDHRNQANTVCPGTGVNVRDDIVSRRRLMWAYTDTSSKSQRQFPPITKPLQAYNYENIMAYRKNAGYGDNKVGTMLTIKQFDADRTDLEMKEVQNSARWLLARP